MLRRRLGTMRAKYEGRCEWGQGWKDRCTEAEALLRRVFDQRRWYVSGCMLCGALGNHHGPGCLQGAIEAHLAAWSDQP